MFLLLLCEILFAFLAKIFKICLMFLSHMILIVIYIYYLIYHQAAILVTLYGLYFPNGTVTFYIKMSSCLYLPSMTKTVEPTSPSCIIIEPDGNVTGYMQSTISRICVSSKFFMKSLSSMAVLISSRDLEKKDNHC